MPAAVPSTALSLPKLALSRMQRGTPAPAAQRGSQPCSNRTWSRSLCRTQAASQQRRSVAASAAADEEGGAATGPGVPPAWDKAMRISADASTMLGAGEALTAELILKKGLAELAEEYPNDPSAALLHTALWNLQQEAGQYTDALKQAEKAHDLMISYFGEDSADAAFHGIRLGISLIVTSSDLDRAQELLVLGGTCAQANLENFWNRLQEMEAAGQETADMALHTKKLMVALAECNFYGAIGIVRRALADADELELPMKDLEEAWLGGTKQMAMALPPEHQMFEMALRELGRLVPDAAGRPALQAELEGVLQRLKELLYLMRNLPDSMKQQLDAQAGQEERGAQAGGGDDEYLP